MKLADVVEFLRAEKAADIVAISLEGKINLAEHMVFVTGVSTRHMRSMADELVERLGRHVRDIEAPTPGVEGRTSEDWMIVDTGPQIVHFMSAAARERYKLERKWALVSADQALSGGDDDEAEIARVEEEAAQADDEMPGEQP
jgi:ribosome-associated protein